MTASRPTRFPPARTFHSLSARDILDARDAYHVHLTNLENVVGTAIGLHRFRKSEIEANSTPRRPNRPVEDRSPRTLDNSAITRRSWPTLLVFVETWERPSELADRPDQLVPRLLYLADGRVVPTCVIHAPRDRSSDPALERVGFARELLGGGYPVVSDVQGVERVGTLGCLVTDGRRVFALTARHVVGRPGEELFTVVKGQRERIGVSAVLQAGTVPLGRDRLTVDAGLVEVEDLGRWSAQVFGIGEVGDVLDLHAGNISLDIVGCPVRAFGGVSGVLEGEIHGLLYRHRCVAGRESVTDVLIGTRADREPLTTRPGDSGTIWFFDPSTRPSDDNDDEDAHPWHAVPAPERGEHARRLRPIAMQWGGTRLGDERASTQFALGSFMSTVCDQLEVQLVSGWNVGHSEYWGKTAHFKIGAKACELLRTPALKRLMTLNKARIGFDDDTLALGKQFSVGRNQFVPLADVPDYVWFGQGMTDAHPSRLAERFQHFADMDEPAPKGPHKGETLLDLCKSKARVTPAFWKSFYDSFPADEAPDPGVLPFRIWQVYDVLVAAAGERDWLRFVCAAGVLSHYVADACQPLHVSRLHHGHAPRKGTDAYEAYKSTPQYKIHAVYEQVMFEVRATEMLDAINHELETTLTPKRIESGHDAAWEAVKLMRKIVGKLPPEEILSADDPTKNQPERGRILYDKLGKKTADIVGDGCRLLVDLWESAWEQGNVGTRPREIREMTEAEVKRMYRGEAFLPAYDIEELVGVLG